MWGLKKEEKPRIMIIKRVESSLQNKQFKDKKLPT